MNNAIIGMLGGSMGGNDKAGGVVYYSVCRPCYESNQNAIYKKFAGSRVMVNIVKQTEANIKCEVCKDNGSIQKV